MSQTEIDFAGRDAVLTRLQRKAVAQWLSYELRCRAVLTGEPVSANDAREMVEGLEVGDKRLFGGIWSPSKWIAVGWTYCRGPGHARRILTFAPKDGAIFEPVNQPDFLKGV